MTLDDWLERIERLHHRPIDLSLDRVRAVAERLGIGFDVPVLVVGGTNGKGSTCAMLEAMLRAAGYRVGLYTSPHLLRFNERLTIDAREVGDRDWCESFARVEAARGDEPLTYFEYATLAAAGLLAASGVDAALLEVGLGGRLDAVNAIPADAALIASIDLDHLDWLGPDRDSIGREKAGIFRRDRIAVCGDRDPPPAVARRAAEVGARYLQAGREFRAEPTGAVWAWHGPGRTLEALPRPGLAGAFQLDNAAACLAVLAGLGLLEQLPRAALDQGLSRARVAARLQRLAVEPEVFVDVAHNPGAARALAGWLADAPPAGAVDLVWGMLDTKDVAGFARALAPKVRRWYPASLAVPRGLSAAELAQRLPPGSRLGGCFERVEDALEHARRSAAPEDRILVAGSFHTAAAAARHLADPASAVPDG